MYKFYIAVPFYVPLSANGEGRLLWFYYSSRLPATIFFLHFLSFFLGHFLLPPNFTLVLQLPDIVAFSRDSLWMTKNSQESVSVNKPRILFKSSARRIVCLETFGFLHCGNSCPFAMQRRFPLPCTFWATKKRQTAFLLACLLQFWS